ncbi:pilus assembly PilX N-terminal domain-containing protein [Alkalithermobacter paradoxus]|uniref:Type 4 fimbrial biogenesis protein PilX N-terminal domain-containing protein n=1 Tax=Alkalithermobacter paradoxus TaxID=29349 RepID=A0A1V4I6K5_9FIRM|nr:hypothetical protein CLOTH_13770 [[Clostridium] thermoalcaliphilum]
MKNNRGSALISTLMIFSVVMILGITLLNISTLNYISKKMNSQSKQSFYLAEGGLDLVYGQVIKEVEKAIEYAKEGMDNFIINNLQYELTKSDEYVNVRHTENSTYYSLDIDKIEKLLTDEFNKEYRRYFLGNKRVEFINSLSSINENGIRINVENGSVIQENNKIKFKIVSNYKENNIEKEITSDVYIKVPTVEDKYINYALDVERINKNPIWDKGIMTNSNINSIQDIISESISEKINYDIKHYVELDKAISIKEKDEIIYIGTENITIEENFKNGIIITSGKVNVNTSKFSGLIASEKDIDISTSLEFTYDPYKTLDIIKKHNLFSYFKNGNEDKFVFLEKIDISNIMGDKNIPDFIEYKNWIRRK